MDFNYNYIINSQPQQISYYNQRNKIEIPFCSSNNSRNENAKKKTTKASIFYINDIHGQVPRMAQITNAALSHDIYVKNNNVDGLKLASGDIMLGKDDHTNKIAVKFLTLIGLDALALGNHEFDNNFANLFENIKKVPFTILGMNLNFPEDKKNIENKIVRSHVVEINGNKYGLIGVQPSSLSKRITNDKQLEGITVDDVDQTIVEIQQEVKKLQQNENINKILLLSHSGIDIDKIIAKEVQGIDIILGGHSHDLIEGIVENENLFYTKSNEPIIITQAGRDGEYFGVLDVEFDENGKIINANNKVTSSNNYEGNIILDIIADNCYGEKTCVIGNLKYVDKCPENRLLEENPYASFIADAMRYELNSDIAFINSGNLRGTLNVGEITNRDISSIIPFRNNIILVNLTQKEIVEALNYYCKSINNYDSKPGVMQVSGLEYEYSSDGELEKLYFINQKGKKEKINIKHPSDEISYIVALDDYVASANETPDVLKVLNTDKIISEMNFDKDKLTIDYIRRFNGKPIEIRLDGRIKIDD